MSFDLVIDSGRDDESQHDVIWNASSGVATWVLEEIHNRVTDAELKATLQPFVDGRYGYVPLSSFTEAQVEQIVDVILGPLLPAARQKWTPDNDLYDIPAIIEELVNETRDWLAAVNAQRRSEGRPEFRPSRG